MINQLQSSEQLNNLLQQDATYVQTWLKRIESHSLNPPEGFNWLGLAEAAAFKARSASNLAWAEVATWVYQRLVAEANNNMRQKESLMISLMMLRATMITKLGAITGHLVLDIDQLTQWFNESLMGSFEEVAKKAGNWREYQVEDIRDLRLIKNRLKVISILADSNKCVLDKELKAWLALREQLP